MPIGRAARLCPHAAFVRPDMEKYGRVSAEIMAVLDGFPPVGGAVRGDGAFIAVPGPDGLHGGPLQAVRRIKARIVERTRLTASAGLATNRFVAKVASELEKPDGLVVVPAGHEASFLAPLEIERIWGVGKVMAAELRSLGVTTIGQLQAYPRQALVRRFGRHGESLHELAFGRDESPVEPFAPAKSMGAENTFAVDCRDAGTLATTLREQAERVARATDALARRFGEDTIVPAALAQKRPRRRGAPGEADTV